MAIEDLKMTCANCRIHIDRKASHCKNCGAKVRRTQAWVMTLGVIAISVIVSSLTLRQLGIPSALLSDRASLLIYRTTSTLSHRAALLLDRAPKQWINVQSWKGSGFKATESFKIQSKEWRIRWKTTEAKAAGMLQVFVYSSTGRFITLAVSRQGIGEDVATVQTPAGRYYLSINSANLKWQVSVEEER
jgi:hypothetical protein